MYGARVYTGADFGTTQSIQLNNSAISDLLSAEPGPFRIGGRVTDGAQFGDGLSDQWIFGASDLQSPAELRITVPEPQGLWSVVIALVTASLWSRRRAIAD